jgi:hypothetical protein
VRAILERLVHDRGIPFAGIEAPGLRVDACAPGAVAPAGWLRSSSALSVLRGNIILIATDVQYRIDGYVEPWKVSFQLTGR